MHLYYFKCSFFFLLECDTFSLEQELENENLRVRLRDFGFLEGTVIWLVFRAKRFYLFSLSEK